MVDMQKNNDLLNRVYEILKLTPEEIKAAIGELAKAQQAAVSAELLKSMTEEEAGLIAGLGQKTGGEQAAAMEKIAKNHLADENFKNRAIAAAKSVINEHIAYLKTRGDDHQKEQIAKILSEIEI
jgi:copper oxidase (laccase) domain-containing protein